jgi:hypothetical protein
MGDLKKFRQKSGEKIHHHKIIVVPVFNTRRNRQGKEKNLPDTGTSFSNQRRDFPTPRLTEDAIKEGSKSWLKKPHLKKWVQMH